MFKLKHVQFILINVYTNVSFFFPEYIVHFLKIFHATWTLNPISFLRTRNCKLNFQRLIKPFLSYLPLEHEFFMNEKNKTKTAVILVKTGLLYSHTSRQAEITQLMPLFPLYSPISVYVHTSKCITDTYIRIFISIVGGHWLTHVWYYTVELQVYTMCNVARYI